MDNNRKLAHIVAYYLSRFDKAALSNLGYTTDKEAFHKIAEALDILPNYVKFRRDEFDVAHPHRKGWHKRPMTMSIINTINTFQDIDEPTLRSLVLDILFQREEVEVSEDFKTLIRVIPDEKGKKQKREYVPRNITGRKAEELFIEWFKSGQEEISQGKDFVDMRDYGCGYDFQIVMSEKQIYAIEVKGFSEDEGGILITGKEWEIAGIMKTDYYLVLVSNIDKDPVITVINNPYEKLSPKRNLQTIIQVSWTVSSTKIRQLKSNLL
ncbi:DUF3883 domain-containing protein [Elizabethkingia anophelis]|uniref:DUF3883 domain-containing protein n=1 Tax=Elizabethkingia anophelis TaxID=1117645 RepID=UPI00162AC01F|nr:DUF3883 domain-containing protein [Elizabethkingia anophelis]MCT3671778.1 DUF3883 domain-containing protein [Elizabethkingia anophelis]MCT3679251.1 DUF3883 domain-containing protein [Elizabethkingia anophelis]MCT3703187.1 DUF3883 domain-containing protein [Elizabethkingia anophelis]MCT3769445.1 DUF3883 domain-containing protein [Elizabethkingia anophelis]MCT3779382.1 DUF3883 domain-containing protein [Elizabethkingia anophelis]